MVRLLWFSLVGVVGFVADTLTLYLCVFGLGLGLYEGRLVSYLVAATTTWYCNRHLTFRDANKSRPLREWSRFLAANAIGGVVNYSVYAVLINASVICASHPIVAVALGSLAGLAFNFTVSKTLVFTKKEPA